LPRSASARKALIDGSSDLAIGRQAELLGIARSTVYVTPTPPSAETLALQRAIDELYTAHPYYGTRRMVVALSRKHGIEVGRDAVRTAMRVLGLTALNPGPETSTPHPEHTVYPYLLSGVSAARPNHIWGTDITYIRLTDGFCYLVAYLDWFSRRVLAWRLSNSLETSFCTETLTDALATVLPEIHNSDQGVQYTSDEYLAVLKAHDSIAISMDGRGRCMDNIFTERLWRTVKYEDVYLKGYATIDEVRDGLTEYFRFYNTERPHQSLGYRTPDEVYYENTKTS
jgi:putative transposase